MKNFLFILVVLSLNASAQRMGLKAGANIGKEKSSSGGFSITSSSSVYFMGGFFISDEIADNLSLGAELIYSMDGGKYDLSNFGMNGVYTNRYQFLSVPVLAKYHASKYFNVQAGPQLGYLLRAETVSGSSKQEFTSDVQPINFSVVIGAETNLKAFDLGIRYVLGITDLNNSSDDSFEVKLNTLQIYLGQTF